MKKAFMLLGLAAMVLATSCEREDLNKVETPQTFESDVAFMVVNINDVNDAPTRASSSGFEYGSTAEYAIYDAHFYFYDSFGEYVAESSSADMGGTASSGTSVDNIEFKANTVITLHGLSGTSYPNWVVTVLNQPLGFVAPIRLADFPETLAETTEGQGTLGEYGIFSKGVGLYVSGTMYYTMSTSSFVPGESQTAEGVGYDATYYFATPVTSANFSLEELTQDSEGNYVGADGEEAVPVEIYVERLVAKTRMSTSLSGGVSVSFTYTEDEEDPEKTYTKTGYAYPIKVEEEASDEDGNLELDEDVTLYVYLDGWRLNGISTDSYISKRLNLDETSGWSVAAPFDGWNDAANYRSYWAMSTAYGDTNPDIWPDSSEGYDYDGAKGTLNDYLRWVDLQQAYLKGFGDGSCEYCAENTNTCTYPGSSNPGVITSEKHVAITNALVKAFIGRIENDTFTPLDLVRVGGLIYTKENYCVYAASHIHLYTREYDENIPGYVYTLIGPDDLVVVDDYDGYVHVEINPDLLETVLYTDTDGTVLGTDVNSYINEHFNSIYGYGANGYTGGMMYYTIPIEHLNNRTSTYTDDDGEHRAVLEGNYGMVRNHIYSITITGIENIGWGIYNPEEVIIPQEDVDTYSITANINILSWKLVEQSVVL